MNLLLLSEFRRTYITSLLKFPVLISPAIYIVKVGIRGIIAIQGHSGGPVNHVVVVPIPQDVPLVAVATSDFAYFVASQSAYGMLHCG